jgi:DNA repair exonuclease SbcCD ATPase subunit
VLQRKYEVISYQIWKSVMVCPKEEFFDEYNLQEKDRKEIFEKFVENIGEDYSPTVKEVKRKLKFLIGFENIKNNLENYETVPLLELYDKKINPLRVDIRPYLGTLLHLKLQLGWYLELLKKILMLLKNSYI